MSIQETRAIPEIFWSADLTSAPVPFSDYRHLNLFLHTPNSVSWTASLPANVTQADFHSAVAISKSAPHDVVSDGVIFQVYVQAEDGPETLAFNQSLKADERDWYAFSIPLSGYAGRKITLRLTSSAGSNIVNDWAMYRYPYIDVYLGQSIPTAKSVDVTRPSNTDLSPDFPKPSPGDFRLDVTDAGLWTTTDAQPAPGGSEVVDHAVIAGPNYSLQYNQPLALRLADYTHLYVRLAASPMIFKRAVKLYFSLNDQPGFDESRAVTIPLLGDVNTHAYSYDLKLLELSGDLHLTGIMIKMLYEPADSEQNRVQISDVRLLHNKP